MIYIEMNSKNEVTSRHFLPFHEEYGCGKSKEELLETGALVDSLPEEEVAKGKTSILKYDEETNTAYYVYEDAPVTEEDELKLKIAELEKNQAETDYVLMMGGLI